MKFTRATNLVQVETYYVYACRGLQYIRWGNNFSQLLGVKCIIDVRQTEIHTEPFIPELSYIAIEIAIAKFKTYE
jgi:hypothetical protein